MSNPNDITDYRPRFTFEISEETNRRCLRLLGMYGTKKAVFGPILEDLLDLIEEHGLGVVAMIIDKSTRPRDIFPILQIPEKETKENGSE